MLCTFKYRIFEQNKDFWYMSGSVRYGTVRWFGKPKPTFCESHFAAKVHIDMYCYISEL